jgi:hypothetical protein
VTSAANSFSNWKLFSGGEFIFCELEDEGIKLLQPPQWIAAGGENDRQSCGRVAALAQLRFSSAQT